MTPATKEDAYEAFAKLVAMKAKSPALQMKFTDEDSALCHMLDCVDKGRAVMVDGYWVQFDYGRAWYSAKNFLIEELILKVYPTAVKVEVAIEALSDLARQHNCVAVAAGDTQIGFMAPKYVAQGYGLLGQQYIKEVPYGLVTQGDGRARSD